MKSIAIRDISIKESQKPEVKLNYIVQNVELVDKDMNVHNLHEIKGMKILSCFPSIDTGVCDAQTKEIYKIAKAKGIQLINVSADLPFAHRRWCLANQLEDAQLLSDYLNLQLGHELGIVIKQANLLYRSLFILNENNQIIYFQFAPKVSSPLDFNAIEEFINKL